MENKKLYCVNAFHNLSVNSTGSIKHCCMIDGSTKNRVLEHPIKELWKDPYMEDVRNSFRNNERHPACIKCWNEEDAGRDSKRIRDNSKFDFAEDAGIKTLELNMGNTCNIKCRTCHPYSSSLWINEYYDTMIEGVKLPKKEFLINAKIYNDSWERESRLWGDLEELGSEVVQIDFYGGEPWLLKKQWEFIEKCVANGWSKNQTLHYNTNGTQWDPELIKLFDHFKFVDIGFSIDGIGPQFEFMRHPAKWDEVYANMQKAREWSKERDNVLFGICHTISALNAYYIPEFLEFFEKEGWHIYLNLVHYPDYYCSSIFPNEIKEEVCKKLEGIDKRFEQAWHQIPGIINFIKDGTFTEWRWKKFIEQIDVHDAYRKENYYETFKEFGELIKKHK